MSLLKVIAAQYANGSASVATVRMDAATHSLQIVTYEHHEIHGGSHYFLKDYADLAINNVIDFQFTTPNTTKWIHLTWNIDAENEMKWWIYEGVTVDTAGTTATPFNNDRNSANTSATTVAQLTGTRAVANTYTDTSGAIILERGIIGSGRDAGSESRDRELILKQNTTYLFRADATNASYINFIMEWYEHTNRN